MKDIEKDKQAEKMADLTFALLEHCQLKQEQMANNLDLTVAEFKLIRSFKDDHNLSVGELAKRMELSSSRLTRILDGLVEKKFVVRELAVSDRRMMEVKLTASGKKIQEAINEIYIKTHRDILELLPPGADESVIFAMEKLRDAMKKWTMS
ncbi:MAG: MarR family transcriptional regulator [Ignavibacteriales bacterium]|nr:MarR family transcriptional regulator [Ignavibacteriales bacterium]